MSKPDAMRRWVGFRLIVGCALFLLILFSLQEPVHAAAEVADGTAGTLDLELHKGKLIRLDRPATAVFVADPAIADIQLKSARLIYVFGKTVGETTLYALDKGENVITNLSLHVSHNMGRLRDLIATIAPGAGVQVQSVDHTLLIQGNVESATVAANIQEIAARFTSEGEKVINRLAVNAPNQVNLRVRVAEVSRSATKQLGINWDALFNSGTFLFGLATGHPAIAGAAFLTRQGDPPSNSVFGGYTNGNFDINGVIDALADEGMLSILAEPNLTALSGETASFLAGGEFPIPVPQQNNAITIEFKRFGVYLSFMPVVQDGGRISLRVAPEVSQLSSAGSINIQNFIIPALTMRQAQTTVELASGQSFAIAGLIQNNTNQDLSKVPGIGEIPILGPLFRSDKFKRDETELVIIVTPYLVRAVSKHNLAAPTDGLIDPNDNDRIVKGRVYGDPKEAVPPASGQTKPSADGANFIIE